MLQCETRGGLYNKQVGHHFTRKGTISCSRLTVTLPGETESSVESAEWAICWRAGGFARQHRKQGQAAATG